jgi:hypothetical protein
LQWNEIGAYQSVEAQQQSPPAVPLIHKIAMLTGAGTRWSIFRPNRESPEVDPGLHARSFT